MSKLIILQGILATIFVIVLSSCVGTRTAINEQWSLVELLSRGEMENVFTEKIVVRNCGNVEQKTTSCTSGTSNDLSVEFGGDVLFGQGIGFSIGAGVSSELGIGRESSESVELISPPEGIIYTYTVKKTYHIISGEVLARLENGTEQNASYSFHASCSIEILDKEQTACDGAQPDGAVPTETVSTSNTKSPSQIPTATEANIQESNTSSEFVVLPQESNFDWGVWSNASSVQVQGGCARLWRDLTWNGGPRDYLEICNSSQNIGNSSDWNDQIKEVEVLCAAGNNVEVTLWEHANFSGNQWKHSFCSD